MPTHNFIKLLCYIDSPDTDCKVPLLTRNIYNSHLNYICEAIALYSRLTQLFSIPFNICIIVTLKFDLPFEFGQPRRISETFGKRIAVDFQFGYL